MICPKCQKEIADGSSFCNYCGERISKPIVDYPKAQMLEKKKSFTGIVIVLVVIGVVLLFHLINFIDEHNRMKTIEDEALNSIMNGNYDDAETDLAKYTGDDEKLNHPNFYVMYSYAAAKEAEKKGDFSMALYCIYNDPDFRNAFDTYDGPLKKDILNLRNKLTPIVEKQDKEDSDKREREQKQFEATRHKRGVSIGMTTDEVLKSNWGKPEHINRTTTANGVEEQWVYRSGNYLYFEENEYGLLVLTSIQN